MVKARNHLVLGAIALLLPHDHGAHARTKVQGFSPVLTSRDRRSQGLPSVQSHVSTLPPPKASFVEQEHVKPHPPLQPQQEGLVVDTKQQQQPVSSTSTKHQYRSAIVKTSIAVSSAVLFGVLLMATRGVDTGYEFFAGYLVEQSLSIDNLFVFIMLFDYFAVPMELQSRVLSWGITGAIFLRGLMIGVGITAIQKFNSIALVFAGVLLVSSFKLLTGMEGGVEQDEVADNAIMKMTRRLLPNASADFEGERFFVTASETGKRMATPLFLCLVCIELSDFVFAVDSIPAVLGVSKNPLIVFASNIFAMVAMRSLYTLVARAVTELRYLKPAVASVMGFVGMKMIAEYFHVVIATGKSLGIVCSLLGTGIFASLWEKRKGRIRLHKPSVELLPWFTIM